MMRAPAKPSSPGWKKNSTSPASSSRRLASTPRRAGQHGRVRVVAAGVHAPGRARREGEPGVLGHRQRVHVGAQQHRADRAGRRADARPRRCGAAARELERQVGERLEHRGRGLRQVEPELGALRGSAGAARPRAAARRAPRPGAASRSRSRLAPLSTTRTSNLPLGPIQAEAAHDTRLMMIEPRTAEPKPATCMPGTSAATSSSMSALITSRKSPSVSRVSGRVSSTNTGRTTAFTTPSRSAARNSARVPSIEMPSRSCSATHRPNAPITRRIRKPLMPPSYARSNTRTCADSRASSSRLRESVTAAPSPATSFSPSRRSAPRATCTQAFRPAARRVADLRPRRQPAQVQRHVLVDDERAVAAVARGDQPQPLAHLARAEVALLVGRGQVRGLGQDPDLQQVHGRVARGVVLAVGHAGARGHALQLAGADHRRGAEAVLVLERALEHASHDLHVAVRVRRKALARLDPVLVDHAQRAEAHVLRVVVVGEGERVAALEPAVPGMPALVAAPDLDHGATIGQVGPKGRRGPCLLIRARTPYHGRVSRHFSVWCLGLASLALALGAGSESRGHVHLPGQPAG